MILGISLTSRAGGNQKLMRVTLSFKSALVRFCLAGRQGEIRGGFVAGIRTKVRSAPIVAMTRSVSIFFMIRGLNCVC